MEILTMFLPKSRSALSAAAVLVLLQASATHADTYRDQLRHFTLEIPPGWTEMSAAEVESFNAASGPRSSTPQLTITTGFRMANMAPRTGPMTLISAYAPGVHGCTDAYKIQIFARAPDGSINEKNGTIGELVENVPLRDLSRQGPNGGGVVDRDHKWIINRYSVQAGPNLMQQLQVVHLGNDGFVTLTSHFRSDEADTILPLFVKLNDSIRFDGGYAAPKQPNEPETNEPETATLIIGGAFALISTSLIIIWAVGASRRTRRAT
jgi:hypothetical protein